MVNTINPELLTLLQNPNQLYSGKGRFINNQLNNQTANTSKNATQSADKNFNVNLSAEGLEALQNQDAAANIDTGIFTQKELSPKAQAYLDKLREKYGDDYDFIIADNVDDPQALTAGSTKKYSIILSSDELEKMADDEEYSNQMLGKIDEAVKTADSLIEKAGLEGVQLNNLTISFDENGNTKLFATLEKLSESQQERLDAAKEKNAEESKQAEDEQPKTVSITADNEESFLEQLLNINWEEIFKS